MRGVYAGRVARVHRYTCMCVCGHAPACMGVYVCLMRVPMYTCVRARVSCPVLSGVCVPASCCFSSASFRPQAGSEVPFTCVVPGRFNLAGACPLQKPYPSLVDLNSFTLF